ncbi:hypothetical protein PFISCL1PPCAC_503, partial [Pristionchus fissidentatus]
LVSCILIEIHIIYSELYSIAAGMSTKDEDVQLIFSSALKEELRLALDRFRRNTKEARMGRSSMRSGGERRQGQRYSMDEDENDEYSDNYGEDEEEGDYDDDYDISERIRGHPAREETVEEEQIENRENDSPVE